MEMENSNGQMVIHMKDNGLIIKDRVTELVLNKIMKNMRDIFKMIKDMEKE